MLKVKEHSDLVRDPVSKAIINVDETGYEAYKTKKESMRIRNEQIHQNTESIKELKNDISEIKQLLICLLNKG